MSIERRAKRRGWSDEKKNAKLKRQEVRRERTKTAFGKVLNFATGAAISAVPAASFIGAGVKKLVPGIEKVPVVSEIINESVDTVSERIETTGSIGKAFVAELVPAFEDFQDGNYGKAVVSLVIFCVGAYFTLHQMGLI
jgi:hypothetical protein